MTDRSIMQAEAAQAASAATQIDPVCGMSVDIATAKYKHQHRGETYYFCIEGCRSKFIANPQKYLEPVAAEPMPEGTIYTCPMDPEIRQVGPGSCPICGMALEPELAEASSGPNPELLDMTRRLKVAGLLAIPVVVLEMGSHIFNLHHLVAPATSQILQLLFATPVVWWAGWPFIVRGWQSLFTRHYNMFTLIALGTLVAWGFSVLATLVPGWFPALVRGSDGTVPVYFEAAAVIIVLVLVGQVLELKARERTSDAIRALLNMTPQTAQLIAEDGSQHEVALGDVPEGASLRVRPGDKVPVDGVIVEGDSSLDEALMTGESLPVHKSAGEKVVAGTVNLSGSFVMKAEQVGRNTLLARIVQMVATAQRSRAPIQRLADQVSGWFVPLVVLSALVAFAAWFMFGPEPRFIYAMLAAVAVLIIACPCALGLATPMSIMVGVGRGAQSGVLVRDAEALERMGRVNMLVVDKTGTLTEGRPVVTRIGLADGFDEAEVLRLAASVEQASNHPLAQAIVRAAKARNLPIARVMGFDQTVGKGVFGMAERKRVAVGTADFLASLNIMTAPLESVADELRAQGASTVYVAVNGKLAAVLAIADRVKDSTPEALARLRQSGMQLMMVTGDNATTAAHVANQLGITAVEAGVLPAAKAEIVAGLKAEGYVVAMAGDGINDGPALATADVGLAMGTGTDVAMETAGITLLKGDLAGILRAYHLSQAVMGNIKQNLLFAFIYNAAGIPVAAGLLYPLFGIVLSPIIAAAAMALSSVSVIGNALRLRGLKL